MYKSNSGRVYESFQDMCVKTGNPDFPAPLGGYLERNRGLPHDLAIGDRVRCKTAWIADHLGAERSMVIDTREKEYSRSQNGWRNQAMLADKPGHWYAAGHFQKLR